MNRENGITGSIKQRVRQKRTSVAFEKQMLAKELEGLLVEIGKCRPQRIKPSARLREHLGIDSFTGIEILVAIENRYGLKITEAEASRVVTFSNMVELVNRRLRSHR